MNGPRLEIHLDRIRDNAKRLFEDLNQLGISITAVTKSVIGSTRIAQSFIDAGIRSLGDSQIDNIISMKQAKLSAKMLLIRSPLLSQIESVVRYADASVNTELTIIRALSQSALKSGLCHDIILMVELGDLREGVLAVDLLPFIRQVIQLPGVKIIGIGANLACRNGVIPNEKNMQELSYLANLIEETFLIKLEIVSGGNSANLNWAKQLRQHSRINHLRLGESILLGCETLYRQPIHSLNTNAFTLITEVIESNTKPSLPRGECAQNAFGEVIVPFDQGNVYQSILGIGRQDIDFEGLVCSTEISVMAASSDHLIIYSKAPIPIGTEVAFQINYNTLLRTMISPFVSKKFL